MNQKEIIRKDEGVNYPFGQDHCFVKLASHHTQGELCFIEDTLKPGFHLPRHYHKQMLEVFYILSGQVEFIFDDISIMASVGDTVTVPPNIWHEARCESGGKMLTIFKDGSFDGYLEELAHLHEANFQDETFMRRLAEKYDIYDR